MDHEVWERQLAEADSIEAIFPDEFAPSGSWKTEVDKEVAFTIELDASMTLRFKFPVDYPEACRPHVDCLWTGPGDAHVLKQRITEYVDSLPLGEEMAYAVITCCQDLLADGVADESGTTNGNVGTSECKDPATPQKSKDPATSKKASDGGYASAIVPSAVREADSTPSLPPNKDFENSNPLPLANYYRAESLGEGACGAVMQVYDDEGQQWAAKQFETGEDGGVDNTTLREIGLLRALRAATAMHPNIIPLHDMATINNELCMIMPSYRCSLADALCGGALTSTKGAQVRVAFGLLSAVKYLHACKTMHRDIKPGNVMLTDDLDPVLIDFSLAKLELDSTHFEERAPRTAKERRRKARGKKLKKDKPEGEDAKHSQGVGTPLYMAPEVVGSDDYNPFLADMWSLGIVLLEVFDKDFNAKLNQCEKEKAAHVLVADTVTRLGNKPIPSILKALLAVNPSDRLAAPVALERLQEAVPNGTCTVQQTSMPAVHLRLATKWTTNPPADVLVELRRWTNLFRCSGVVCSYAEKYAARSGLALATPLYAVVLASRLHETDIEAAPLYDLTELEEFLEYEDVESLDEDLVDTLSNLEEYFEAEQQILRELDYLLY